MAQTNNCDREVVALNKTITINESENTTDFPPKNFHVNNNLDILIFLISIISLIIDIAFDIHLAFRYYRNGDTTYFYLTAFFILFPAFVNTVISLRMYVMDEQCSSVSKVLTRKWLIRVIMLFFQLAPILRYCDCLDYALKARRAEKDGDRANQKKYHEMMLKEDSDVALLRVFECFLEAAPQAILQTTILLISNNSPSQSESLIQVTHQVASIVSSLLSMAWSMASYHRLIRVVQTDKNNMTYAGTAMQFMWHFMITVSRILAISGVASVFPEWAVLACVVHWAIMTVWLLLLDRAAFCIPTETSRCNQIIGDMLFCSILGMVYIFTYLTLSDGRTRQKYLAYYPLCFIENVLLAMIWYSSAPILVQGTWYFYPFFILSIVPFVAGIGFMLAYYRCFHPRPTTNKPALTPRNTPRNTPRIPRKLETIITDSDEGECHETYSVNTRKP